MNFKSLNTSSAKLPSLMFGFSFLILLSTFYFLLSGSISAQTAPDFIVTWQSNNYAPSDFRGKILPIDGSQIEMALELLDKGRLANLSSTEIQWLINGNEVKHGPGLKNISFTAEGFKGDQVIAVTIKGYGGQDLTKTITIPLVLPEVIITGGLASTQGGPNLFEALPYFFNAQIISLLKFQWSANGAPATGRADDPSKLTLDISKLPSGAEVVVALSVYNISNPTETATNKVSITK